MRRCLALLLFVAFAMGSTKLPARADDVEAQRLLTELLVYPNASSRTEDLGRLPADRFDIPLPTGLEIVGSVSMHVNGKLGAEAVVYAAPEGTVPDLQAYAAILDAAGWHTQFAAPSSPFGHDAIPAQYCNTGKPSINVQSTDRYLVVRATSGPGTCYMPVFGQRAAAAAKAPFSHFQAPDNSEFLSVNKQAFSAVGDVASTGIKSSDDASALVASFSRQMTDAGWTPRSDANGAGEATFVHQTDGTSWVAALSVVSIGHDTFIFTASAFKGTETQGSAAAR